MSGFLSGRTSLTTVNTSDIAANAIDGTLTKDALICYYSDVTVTAADLIIYGDATDSNNTKRDTVQGFLDLAGGGAWNIIGTSVASSSASLTITGLDSTYDTYAIAVSDAHPATDGVAGWLRLGDSSGIDSGASDYGWGQLGLAINNTAIALIGSEDSSDAQIDITSASDADVGNAASEGMGGLYFLHAPGDGAIRSIITGQTTYINESGAFFGFSVFGGMTSVITLDRVSFLFSSGNIASGRLTVWGLAHA